MPNDIIIRLYRRDDREALRKICCDTADRGEAVENFFSDREIVADAVTRYYTDFEPQHTWVAQVDNRTVGYLMSCFDTSNFFRVMASKVLPLLFLKAFFRGVFFHKDTWRLLSLSLKSMRVGGFKRNIPLEKFPAHLHIDLAKDFRGQGVGAALMENFFNAAKAENIRGVHLSVRQDNHAGCKFFGKMGFTEFAQYPMAMPQGKNFILGATLIYTKDLR